MQGTNKHYQFTSEYLNWVKAVREHVAKGGRVRIFWSSDALDAAGFSREFMMALNRRINVKGGMLPEGRKHSEMYQVGLMRDSHRLQDMARRIRVYQLETPELTRRFGHKLASRNE